MCENISDTVIKCELINIDYINSSDQTIEEYGYTQDIDPPVKCEIIDVRSECERQSSDNKPKHQKDTHPYTSKAILAIEHIEEDIDGNDMIKALRAQNSHRNRIIGYRCKWNECDYVSHKKKNVEIHVISKHMKNSAIKCHLCETQCLSSESLKQHKASKHSNTEIIGFACEYPECSFVAKGRRYLRRHVNGHIKPFVCDWPDCGHRFSRSNYLTNHVKGVHLKQHRFRCVWPGCDKAYTDSKTLKQHRNMHTGKQFACIWPACEFSSYLKSSLRKHRKNHLMTSAYNGKSSESQLDKKYVCNWPECGKKFANNYNMIKHMRIHSGERPFKCEWTDCKRTFAEQGNLIKHMRTHTSKQR